LREAAPAIVVIAGYDPLVDEGAEYADRLEAAGVDVRLRRHDGLIHGFMSCAGAIRTARMAIDELCVDIVDALARNSTNSTNSTRTGVPRRG
jgi:acetyl esterase/lipase